MYCNHCIAGQMAVWVGGDKEAYTKVRPVLDASYSSVMYTGGLGTAMIPKVNISRQKKLPVN